jgi:transcriptional regulator with XRE-family HTH domain
MKTTMGEKIKDLRVERHMTTKQLAQATGISEAVINGLENDNGRDVGYSRIVELAKFFDVPTDFLLGFTESRITKNIELKQLGLTDKAIEVLLAKHQDNELVSKLIEHTEFVNLINAIDIYITTPHIPHTVNTIFHSSLVCFVVRVCFPCCDYITPRICCLFNKQIRAVSLHKRQKCNGVLHKRQNSEKLSQIFLKKPVFL